MNNNKAVLVALNAKYIHTNLALRSILAYSKGKTSLPLVLEEGTINQHFDDVLARLYAHKASLYLFSCYIWNIEMICALAAELHKLLPGALLFAGGPQVSYGAANFLEQYPAFTGVIRGEGEEACLQLFETVEKANSFTGVSSLTWRALDGLQENPIAAPLHMDALPFPYPVPLQNDGHILYYESMRGCPYRCSYCLSGSEGGVRCKSVPLVQKELDTLLAAKPRQVKFVDRTFNCVPQRATAIWQYLIHHDNGVTNFHFELAAEALTDEMVALLAKARTGLFQFEIGVQSCNEATLREIQRPANLTLLFSRVRQLQAAGNIHLHLDLIAGLPLENAESFAQSFNTVHAAKPHQLQLGFLKLLPGSGMEQKAAEYGLLSQSRAPFEILQNKWLAYGEITELKKAAEMVELFYNSGRFTHTASALCAAFHTPFAFYTALADAYEQAGYFTFPPSKKACYELLGVLAKKHCAENLDKLQWLCRLDMALHEKPHTAPSWVQADGSRPYREQVLAFYGQADSVGQFLPNHIGREAKQLLKMAHIEVFPFHPVTGKPGPYALLFDYTRRDLLGHAFVQQIDLL